MLWGVHLCGVLMSQRLMCSVARQQSMMGLLDRGGGAADQLRAVMRDLGLKGSSMLF